MISMGMKLNSKYFEYQPLNDKTLKKIYRNQDVEVGDTVYFYDSNYHVKYPCVVSYTGSYAIVVRIDKKMLADRPSECEITGWIADNDDATNKGLIPGERYWFVEHWSKLDYGYEIE